MPRTTVPQAEVPVFYDPSGSRWDWIRFFVILLAILTVTAATWLGPRLVSPPQNTPYRTERPETSIKTLLTDDGMPAIGSGPLVRINRVRQLNGNTYLVDPFSGAVRRKATPYEIKLIGSHTSVMERFGKLNRRQLALTFDDGPSAKYTPQLLDLLARHSVPATFFVVGEHVLEHPNTLRRMVREGHMIGGHTLTHARFESDTLAKREEFIGTQRIIRDIADYDTRLSRLPYGGPELNPLGVAIGQQLGYQEVNFTLDTHDWEYGPDETIPLPKLDGSGHVIVMHDGGTDRLTTLHLVERLIKEARAKGYTFTTLAPLLDKRIAPTRAKSALDDRISRVGLWAWLVAAERLLIWNRWFMISGIILAALITILYIVLALHKHRYRSLQLLWPTAELEPDPVSVVIPTKNEGTVIGSTIEQLAYTAHPQFEVIVVDNGSTDDTLDVLHTYAERYPWLRILTSPPGKATALNRGIRAATYDIVVTIDADTLVTPTTLTMLARHFADPRVGGVAGNIKVGNLNNLLTRFQAVEYLNGICIYKTAEGVAVAPGALAAWRKRVLQEVGGVHADSFAEDFDLTLRVRRAGWHVIQDNEAVAYTEAPETLRGLWGQRVRWMHGTMQVMWKHRAMFCRPRYGWLGMYLMPNIVVSMFLPLVFMPLWFVTVVLGIWSQSWLGLAMFSLFAATINFLSTAAAIQMAKERKTHLWIVPIYWYIYGPLRMFVAYAATMRCLKGKAHRWFSPVRTNSVATAEA